MLISLEEKMIHVVLRTCDRHSLQSTRIVNKKECIIRCLNSILKELDIIEKKHLHIIDDNSSENDRQFMKERYPFIRFIYKTPEQKGHPRSMNMLLKEIKTPYVFNLEDDFEFFRRDHRK
jgi:glycosyltransferase involved in cell wall biosynthesis